jgi:hypothetical protein
VGGDRRQSSGFGCQKLSPEKSPLVSLGRLRLNGQMLHRRMDAIHTINARPEAPSSLTDALSDSLRSSGGGVPRLRPQASVAPSGGLSRVHSFLTPPDLSSGQISPQTPVAGQKRHIEGEAQDRDEISEQVEEVEDGPSLTYAQGGNFVSVRIPGCAPVGGGAREKITGFSAKSRRALLRVVNSIDQGAVRASEFVFITLTYPEAFPSARASKRDLDTFAKRFTAAQGRHWFIWKLEPQQRGAPHYHLLAFMPGQRCYISLLEWVARAWHEIAGGGDENHLKWHLGALGNRPCVEVVKDFAGVGRYASKYLGKATDGGEEWQHPGRYWGQRHPELAPITRITESVDLEQAKQMRRQCIRYFEHQASNWFRFSGKQRADGTHIPGFTHHGSHRFSLNCSTSGQQAVRVRDHMQEIAQILGVEVRQQKRRWPTSRGGFSGFMPAETFKRLLTWSRSLVDTCIPEEYKRDHGEDGSRSCADEGRTCVVYRRAGQSSQHEPESRD